MTPDIPEITEADVMAVANEIKVYIKEQVGQCSDDVSVFNVDGDLDIAAVAYTAIAAYLQSRNRNMK